MCHSVIKSESPGRREIRALLPWHVVPCRLDRFYDAFRRGGSQLAGFTAQRPERYTGNGPGVLWSVGSRNYIVIDVHATSVPTALALRMSASAHGPEELTMQFPLRTADTYQGGFC